MKKYRHFGKVVFHFENELNELSDSAVESLFGEIGEVLKRHDAELDEYELHGLPSDSSPIEKCVTCGYLTLDIERCPEGLDTENGFPELERILHLGRVRDGNFICSECNDA